MGWPAVTLGPDPLVIPGATVRQFTETDIDPARWLVYRAYFEVLLELYGPEAAAQYEIRSRDFMRLYLARDGAGCFSADDVHGDLAGVVFCFAWGEVGWFGSLAVDPASQGHGLGQALIGRAADYLASRGCRRIGLETWPAWPQVRHLYGKFGFQECRSTIKLSRPVSASPTTAGWKVTWYNQASTRGDPELAALQQALRQVSESISGPEGDEPRGDYGAEARFPVAAGWADAAVLWDRTGYPQAAALCYRRKPSGTMASALDVRLLLVDPRGGEAALDALLVECDRRALALGFQTVTCDVNLRYSHAAALLRARGYRPIYELVRMERPTPGFDPMSRRSTIECARWAG